MDAANLLQWHYMVFLLPFGAAAFLLILSSLRFGHHHGGGGHGHHGHIGHITGHGHAHVPAANHAHGHGAGAARAHGHSQGHSHHSGARHGQNGKDDGSAARDDSRVTLAGVALGLIGVGRAPLPMVLESFCLAWGFCGYWANQYLLHTPAPTFAQMLPSLGIALAGGVLGARGAAEIIARLLPRDETAAVSRDTLFGLTGTVAFPVGETAGRIHVYDEFGTLHDETCRVAAGHPAIPKGRRALVVDVDSQGNLIIEEIADSVKKLP